MEGDARTWALPALEDLKKGGWPYQGQWSTFEKEFSRWFIPLDPAETAREQLKRLKQSKSSVTEYKAKFDEQAPLTRWSSVDLRSHFYNRLSKFIKDALAISD